MAARVVATATVRAATGRKLMPMRAALTLVSGRLSFVFIFIYVLRSSSRTKKKCLIISQLFIFIFSYLQTPAAVNRVKQLLENKNEFVSFSNVRFTESSPIVYSFFL